MLPIVHANMKKKKKKKERFCRFYSNITFYDMLKDSNFCDHRMTFVSIDNPGTIFGRMRMMFSHLCASSCG